MLISGQFRGMNISINEQNQEHIKQKVDSGHYSSQDEVMDTALRLLDERDKYLEELSAKVNEGIDQIERGEYVEYTDDNLHEQFEEIETEALHELEARRNHVE